MSPEFRNSHDVIVDSDGSFRGSPGHDYDLCNEQVPQNQEEHGIRGEPVYAAGAGFDSARLS